MDNVFIINLCISRNVNQEMVPSVSSVAENIHNLLKSKHHGVSINTAWISDALSSESLTADQIYKKWLTTDMMETGGECLPSAVTSMSGAKIEIPGTLTLQLQSVLNVGSSFYSQLKKITGKPVPEASTQNTQYSTQNSTQNNSQYNGPPPSRMLFLTLTDGTNIVSGMEYKPCTQLSVNLLPGTKILVSHMTARIGVLLLQPGNFRLLGGCVERLRLLYTQERVLKSAMEGEEEGEEEEDDKVTVVNIGQTNPQVTSSNSVNRVQANASDPNVNPNHQARNNTLHQHTHVTSGANTIHNPYTATNNPTNQNTAKRSHPTQQKLNIVPSKPEPLLTQNNSTFSAKVAPSRAQYNSVSHSSKRLKTDPGSSSELQITEHDLDDDFEEFFEPDENFPTDLEEPKVKIPSVPEIPPDIIPISCLTTNLPFPVKITATICSLASKLRPDPEWTSQALLSDRSGTKNIRLSEKLLAKLIGFTSQEFKKLKPVGATNPGIKAFLRKGLETFQEEVAFKTGVFTVQLNTVQNNLSPFEVVDFEKIDEVSERNLKEYVRATVQ